MKPTIPDNKRKPGHARGRPGRTAALLATVAISVCTAVRLEAVVIDDFEDGVKFDEGSGAGTTNYFRWAVENGQLVVSTQYPIPTPHGGVLATYDNIYWPAPRLPEGNLEGGRTLELRMDLNHLSADDLFFMPMCGGQYEGAGTLYSLLIDRNEVALMKGGPSGYSTFFWDTLTTTNENVTVKLAFTKTNSSLVITVKIVDKGNQRATLYERTFVDGPGQDGPVPPPDPHGYGFFVPDPGASCPAFSYAAVGCSQMIFTTPPPLEMQVDNVEYDVYDPPTLEIANSVLLSWSASTEEEQIVVGADSPTGPVWTPWPEPIFKRFGQMGMTVPTTASQQYFKLVPGTQFADCFSDSWGPFTNRDSWVSRYQDPTEEWVVTNGVLQVKCNSPFHDAFALLPLGMNVEARHGDFCMSVDVLDWVTSSTNFTGIFLFGRADPNTGIAYMGALNLNRGGLGKVYPFIKWDYPTTTIIRGSTNDLQLPYRLQFSGVGPRLTLRVLNPTNAQLIEELSATNAPLAIGVPALYFEGRNGAGDSYTIKLDNFGTSGTKP